MEESDTTSKLKPRGGTKDLTGVVFGRLNVVSFSGYEDKKFRATWLCRCSCGNDKTVLANDLLRGYVKSCGCLLADNFKTHGLSNIQEYRSWAEVKIRCYNQNSKAYSKYGAVGLVMDDEFTNDFNAFLAEIGNVPDDVERWTVDRLDNSKGYIKGNIRWATYAQQARNKTKMVRNSTGVTGVKLCSSKLGYQSFTAQWQEIVGDKLKRKSRSFSILKYGYDGAFELACEARESAIDRLNSMGYGYTENHGK